MISAKRDVEIVTNAKSCVMVVTYFLATKKFVKMAILIQTIVFKYSDKSDELAYFSKK